MTMYFPLVVHGPLLMEPKETESRDSLDQFVETIPYLARRAKSGDKKTSKKRRCTRRVGA